jgi:hypothetical protein
LDPELPEALPSSGTRRITVTSKEISLVNPVPSVALTVILVLPVRFGNGVTLRKPYQSSIGGEFGTPKNVRPGIATISLCLSGKLESAVWPRATLTNPVWRNAR